jgi:hypothetical protein
MSVRERELVRDIQFKTIFRVYLCLLTRKEASIKDVQIAMLFRTPAQAKYHLERLRKIGLVIQTDEGNFRVKRKRFGVLRFFLEAYSRMIPMSAFYVVFFAFTALLMYLRNPTVEVLLLGALITVKEAADTYMYIRML